VFIFTVMHYSAKRGLAIACRPSICLSVPSATLVDQDHIGWKSWKLIARTISPPLALFVAYRGHPRTPTGTGEILGRPEVGGEKWCAEAIAGAQKRQYL